MEDNNRSDNKISKLCLSYDNQRSDSESTHSTPEDERIKRLFFTCDINGDGFITYEDIKQVCIQLEMEYCVDEIMQELGTDTNGRISYTEFVKRRSELLDITPNLSDTSEDCESTISESKEPLLEESSHTSSQDSSYENYSNRSPSVTDGQAFGLHRDCNQLKTIWSQREVTLNETESSGLSNTDESVRHQTQDSWEFDSGAHDLEVDTTSLHRQIEASGIEMPTNINDVLELANKYYIESIHCLKQEKHKIQGHFKSILKEQEFLQKQIIYLKEEKISIIKDLEKKKLRERKEYFDKITELQSIIAELSQHLHNHQFLTIKEEDNETNEADNHNLLYSGSSQSAVKLNDKQIEKQNDWVMSETENVNNSDYRIDGNDSHANALQIDRLESRISNLEAQLDLSSLHLSESKENAERLTVLLAKYESNNTALELALNYSEKALEINELFVKLLESEIGLVLANCRAAGLGKTGEMSERDEKEEVVRVYELAQHKRQRAEESVLEYLHKYCNEFEIKSENTFSRELQYKLKDICNQLILEKSIVKNSITILEPIIVDSESMSASDPLPKDSTNSIESIVLKQEFVSIKEMNANLRSEIYSLQKQKSILAQQVIKLAANHDNSGTTECSQVVGNEEKDQMSDDSVEHLKKVNAELCEELLRVKKKYLIKSRKMDQKMAFLSQRTRAHVKILQNKISLLQNKGSVRQCIETTL